MPPEPPTRTGSYNGSELATSIKLLGKDAKISQNGLMPYISCVI